MSVSEHEQFVAALRRRVLEGPGETSVTARQAAAEAAAGQTGPMSRVQELARQIGEASYRVTDEQVAATRASTGSQKAAFEIVAAAALGAGLFRWDAATAVLREANDASR